MPTLVWRVSKGDWNVHAIYTWLCDMGFIRAFNDMDGELQYEFLVCHFGE